MRMLAFFVLPGSTKLKTHVGHNEYYIGGYQLSLVGYSACYHGDLAR